MKHIFFCPPCLKSREPGKVESVLSRRMEGLNPLASATGNWADWSKRGTGEQQMQGQQHAARKNAGGIPYPVRRNALV